MRCLQFCLFFVAEPCVVVLQATRPSTRIRTDCSPFMRAPKVLGVPMLWAWMACLIACKVCSTTGPSKYRIQDIAPSAFRDIFRHPCTVTPSIPALFRLLSRLLCSPPDRRSSRLPVPYVCLPLTLSSLSRSGIRAFAQAAGRAADPCPHLSRRLLASLIA